MEHIHGIDVSWMTHGSPKDKVTKTTSPSQRRHSVSSPPPHEPSSLPQTSGTSTAVAATDKTNDRTEHAETTTTVTEQPPLPNGAGARPTAGDKEKATSGERTIQRRPSWFSNISSRFSSGHANSPPQANNAPPKQGEFSVPKITPAKNAVLPHATKNEGDAPYTPAPPKTGQTGGGFLHVLRRFSSSGGALGPGVKGSHGLVDRRILNVDRSRERCKISALNQAKLRRVAFMVDVEIAPMPKYADGEVAKAAPNKDRAQTRKVVDKGEGEALKHPKAPEDQKEPEGKTDATGEPVPKESEKEGTGTGKPSRPEAPKAVDDASQEKERASDKKKEKKKKSEEERKARKEKKRKLAEANGQIPMEIYAESSDSSSSDAPPQKVTSPMPTTNPVRIYRRCCQLRETPILKKITEQLSAATNSTSEVGVVEKLDLSGYWLQLADLVTLGDYLAVVPVKEVILENCGLNDEGLRVILAGLLAAKKPAKRRKHAINPRYQVHQGGVVEKLVLKNNKIGPEGWKNLCLFLYMCRSLKCLDISNIPFPQKTQSSHNSSQHGKDDQIPLDLSDLLSKAIGDRLAGSRLELINLGETGLTTHQLGIIIDGIGKCGIRRLGLAHNNIDARGLQHVARFLKGTRCEGLDIGGNDLREHLATIADVLTEDHPLWALSLAECNLDPKSLCKLFMKLVNLRSFRFIDLSHNHDLFKSDPSAVGLLRRNLPKMHCLKRIHLADVAMNSEQAIALTEVLPEVQGLAHVNFLENPELTKLADARTEESQEEACALYASLLAATRVSGTIVCFDIDVPSEQSGEIVRALAKQVVAYCLRNMERIPVAAHLAAATKDAVLSGEGMKELDYPDVLAHLVGNDAAVQVGPEMDDEPAPDEDYIIGGTGIAKALTSCLKNCGDESRRLSGEFTRDAFSSGTSTPKPRLPAGKAKDASKHLLSTARKIRVRLQPALAKAKAGSSQDEHTYRRLLFLDSTLDGIIKRFEDEFPETRESLDSAISLSIPPSSLATETEAEADLLDLEPPQPHEVRPSAALSRSNSVISSTSKGLTNEEGRVLRAGHKLRAGLVKQEHYGLLASGVEDVANDPNHKRLLGEMLEEMEDPELDALAARKGLVAAFKERREQIIEFMRNLDPDYWHRFLEAQTLARANIGGAKREKDDGMEGQSAIVD